MTITNTTELRPLEMKYSADHIYTKDETMEVAQNGNDVFDFILSLPEHVERHTHQNTHEEAR